jgi:hypothetical protein
MGRRWHFIYDGTRRGLGRFTVEIQFTLCGSTVWEFAWNERPKRGEDPYARCKRCDRALTVAQEWIA